MSTPETPNQGETIATPEAYYSEQIKKGLAELTQIHQLVLRKESPEDAVDKKKDELHALLDEAVEQSKWVAEKREFGDMDQARFERPQ